MTDDTTRGLLEEVRREIEDATQEISQAVQKLEENANTDSEALLGEAMARLKIIGRRIDDQLAKMV